MTIKWEAGSIATLLSTELDALANAGAAISTNPYDNSDASNLFLYATFELAVTFGSNATAGTTCDLYVLPSLDGTNYADNVNQSGLLVCQFTMRAATAHRVAAVGVLGNPISIPWLKLKWRLVNNSGQAFPASGSTVKMTPGRLQ